MSTKIPFEQIPASPILARYQPRPETIALAEQHESALRLLDQLIVKQDFAAAIEFVGHWMPPQAVVWWGCLCLWECERIKATAQFESSIAILIEWLQKPEESERRQLTKIMEQYPLVSPIHLLAKAAFISGGSIAPAGLPEVAAPKQLFAVLASSAIKLVCAKSSPSEYSPTCRQALRMGLEVLRGANQWSKPVPQQS